MFNPLVLVIVAVCFVGLDSDCWEDREACTNTIIIFNNKHNLNWYINIFSSKDPEIKRRLNGIRNNYYSPTPTVGFNKYLPRLDSIHSEDDNDWQSIYEACVDCEFCYGQNRWEYKMESAEQLDYNILRLGTAAYIYKLFERKTSREKIVEILNKMAENENKNKFFTTKLPEYALSNPYGPCGYMDKNGPLKLLFGIFPAK